MENRNPIGLRREQVQALGVLIKQPDVFSALESVFADMRATALRDYDAAKDALVFAEGARSTAQITYGKVLALNDILDLFARQKV